MPCLRKRELEKLILEEEKKVKIIKDYTGEEHDCVYSFGIVLQQGRIAVLKEIYDKYYCVKKKDSLKKRRKQTIEMLGYLIEIKQIRSNKYLKKGHIKHIDLESIIYDLKKKKEELIAEAEK